jgi:hypothetical protein
MYAARGDQFIGLMNAYRKGLGIAFAELAEEIPSIEIATLDKTHVSVILEPEALAERMIEFVAD